MKTLTTLIATLFILNIFQTTFAAEVHEEITALNEEFNHYSKYPILIFEREKLKKEIIEKAIQSEKERLDYIDQYVQSRVQVKLSKGQLSTLDDYLMTETPSPLAFPFTKGWSMEYEMCVVFPREETPSAMEEVKRLSGYSFAPENYEGKDINALKDLFTAEEFLLYSLYHELSHCLDPKYIPRAQVSNGGAHQFHMAESFAEVNALFMLAKRKDMFRLGNKRALLRSLYTKYAGPKLAKMSNPDAIAQGAVYYLAPVLYKAQERLLSYTFSIQDLSLSEMIDISKELTENHAYSSRTFHAVIQYLSVGEKEALAQYEKYLNDMPELFIPTYMSLQLFHTQMKMLDQWEKLASKF
ncbi:hypothetical protein HBN50_11865 [Halobacteriovorax sp. GB3]|uniref:hypothetical protein n=1 Tax=Halobacteriovorax sp. GB3 TaxID=2719615 RepID=UPI0023626954|nr:hypothetical protein [Halobacteriovorax sp. GB3]MDD0853797.1 hypothetical protein [Halobacteriovorax sp. GB3]